MPAAVSPSGLERHRVLRQQHVREDALSGDELGGGVSLVDQPQRETIAAIESILPS